MKVLLVHGEIPHDAPSDERETLFQAEMVEGALRRRGHDCARGLLTLDLGKSVEAWGREEPDVVFNLVESLGGRGEWFALGARALELLGKPFTGNGFMALALTANKPMWKGLLGSTDVPTPPWTTLDELERSGASNALARDRGVIVKAAGNGGGSVGLRDDSVLGPGWTDGQLIELMRAREREFGSAFFAESYIDGREFKVGIIPGPGGAATDVLPIVELDYSTADVRRPRVLTYDRTWGEESPDDSVGWSFASEGADTLLRKRLEELVLRCWKGLSMRGWARFDIRVDAAGSPWLVDVNANCSVSPEAGLFACAEQAGLGYDDMIERIVHAAL